MATPEGKVKNKVKEVLKRYNVYWHCPVQNGMGAPSLDFICCIRGKYFGIETKAANKKPTPRQETTIHSIQSAGGVAFVVNEVEGMDLLELWLNEVTK